MDICGKGERGASRLHSTRVAAPSLPAELQQGRMHRETQPLSALQYVARLREGGHWNRALRAPCGFTQSHRFSLVPW